MLSLVPVPLSEPQEGVDGLPGPPSGLSQARVVRPRDLLVPVPVNVGQGGGDDRFLAAS